MYRLIRNPDLQVSCQHCTYSDTFFPKEPQLDQCLMAIRLERLVSVSQEVTTSGRKRVNPDKHNTYKCMPSKATQFVVV